MGLGGGSWDTKMRQKTCTLSQKVGRKRVPLGRKSTSKPLIIWDTKMRQKRVPLANLEAGRRRDEPGKENAELKN